MILLLLLLTGWRSAPPLHNEATIRNVLVIVADDVGHPEVPVMPNLQALAAQGTSFTRAYASTMCCPGRYSLLFGRWPRRDGIGQNPLNPHDPTAKRLPLERTSLAELLQPTHATALFGKWHLGRAPSPPAVDEIQSGPPWCGFDYWGGGSPAALTFGDGASGYRDWWRVEGPSFFPETQYATNAQRDSFISWWVSTPGPRFAVLAWSAAHNPFDNPPGYGTGPTMRARYENVVEYMDAQLAAVLASVNLSDTYVVWCGDNGTPNEARPPGAPFNEWKFTTHEGGIRVPLVVVGPGIDAGVTTNRLVMLNDVPATLAELTGTAVAAGFEDSQSFADELGSWGGGTRRTFAFCERYAPGVIDSQAVVENAWKLRRHDDDEAGPLPSEDIWYALTAPGVEREVPASFVPQGVRDRIIGKLASLPPRAP